MICLSDSASVKGCDGLVIEDKEKILIHVKLNLKDEMTSIVLHKYSQNKPITNDSRSSVRTLAAMCFH